MRVWFRGVASWVWLVAGGWMVGGKGVALEGCGGGVAPWCISSRVVVEVNL